MSQLQALLAADAAPVVMVQGMTGSHGQFHTQQMLAAGTPVVCGVTPGKGGQTVLGLPVYNTVKAARQIHPVTISLIFVPAAYAKAAIVEAAEAGVKLIICITEHMPVHDLLEALRVVRAHCAELVGPNCPGLLLPGRLSLGIIPASIGRPGEVAIVSRSGTLTYEAAAGLSQRGVGQHCIVGIGGDQLRGTSFVDCLAAFEAEPGVRRIMLIGEIGGQAEQAAASYIARRVSKPVYAYVVGHSAPAETRLGHAGAIMGNADESAAAKTFALAAVGAITASSLPALLDQLEADT